MTLGQVTEIIFMFTLGAMLAKWRLKWIFAAGLGFGVLRFALSAINGKAWLLAGVVLLAATVGKGVACYAAARWQGESHREGMAIGALMNARGLMELIILNIGLARGIIEPALFTVMVLMAVATTLMATPIFQRVYGSAAERARGGP